jgi:hypothetical protein
MSAKKPSFELFPTLASNEMRRLWWHTKRDAVVLCLPNYAQILALSVKGSSDPAPTPEIAECSV